MDDGVAVSADGDTSSDVDERRILLRHARETIRVLEEQLCAAAVAVADVVATAHSHPIGEFDVLDDDRLSETTEGIPIVFDELAAILLSIILHGLKEHSHAWNFIRLRLGDDLQHPHVSDKALNAQSTSLDDITVWIRQGIFNKNIVTYFERLVGDPCALLEYYTAEAFCARESLMNQLLSSMGHLIRCNMALLQRLIQRAGPPRPGHRPHKPLPSSSASSSLTPSSSSFGGRSNVVAPASSHNSISRASLSSSLLGRSTGSGRTMLAESPRSVFGADGRISMISPSSGGGSGSSGQHYLSSRPVRDSPQHSTSASPTSASSSSCIFPLHHVSPSPSLSSYDSVGLVNSTSQGAPDTNTASPRRSSRHSAGGSSIAAASVAPVARSNNNATLPTPRCWINAATLMDVSSQIFSKLTERTYASSDEMEFDSAHMEVADALIGAVERMQCEDRLVRYANAMGPTLAQKHHQKQQWLLQRQQHQLRQQEHEQREQQGRLDHDLAPLAASSPVASPDRSQRIHTRLNFERELALRPKRHQRGSSADAGRVTSTTSTATTTTLTNEQTADECTPLDTPATSAFAPTPPDTNTTTSSAASSRLSSPQRHSHMSYDDRSSIRTRSSSVSSFNSASTTDSVPVDPSQWRSMYDTRRIDAHELVSSKLPAELVARLYLRSLTTNQLDPPALRLLVSDADVPEQAVLPWPKLNKPRHGENDLRAVMSAATALGKSGGAARAAAAAVAELHADREATLKQHHRDSVTSDASSDDDRSSRGDDTMSIASSASSMAHRTERTDTLISTRSTQSDVLRLRGTDDWAPPRQQIIFTLHKRPSTREGVARQHYRCAGCSIKVEAEYAKRFRYCEYLGKFFCTSCHSQAVAIIPARILHKWDFSVYRVSNFALSFLNGIYEDPLFDLGVINEKLYDKIKPLIEARVLRWQLFFLQPFLSTCRLAKEQGNKVQCRSYIATDPDLYSLQDLVRTAEGGFVADLQRERDHQRDHVLECPLCAAKGFMCEFCRSNDVFFPFELSKAVQCDGCKSFYHRSCYDAATCPKCQRIRRRKRQAKAPSVELGETTVDEGQSQPAATEEAVEDFVESDKTL